MFDRLEDLLHRYEEIMNELSEPGVADNQDRFRKLMKEQSDLTPLVEAYREYKKAKKDEEDSLAMLEEEMEAILMERIRDKANTERYDRMIQKREAEIAAAQKQIEELQNIEETLRSRQAKLKRDISMMDDILKEGHLSEAHLRLLVDKIYVHEENGKLSLDICLKAPFRDHMDIYENGEQTECYLSQSYDFERLGPIIMKDFWENG